MKTRVFDHSQLKTFLPKRLKPVVLDLGHLCSNGEQPPPVMPRPPYDFEGLMYRSGLWR